MRVFVELQPNLGVCHVSCATADPAQLKITANSIQITSRSKMGSVDINMPPNVVLHSGDVSLRQQADASGERQQPALRIPMNVSELAQSHCQDLSAEIQTLKSSMPLMISCKFCHQPLTRGGHVAFRRVLEMPSENWQEMASALCCHDELSDLSQIEVGPRVGDLLLGPSTLMIHVDDADLPSALAFAAPQSKARFFIRMITEFR